jgi:hypothetical protein
MIDLGVASAEAQQQKPYLNMPADNSKTQERREDFAQALL